MMYDTDFLDKLDAMHLRTQWVKMELLDFQENALGEIQGKVTSGSISVNGSSAIRRTINFTMAADRNNSSIQDIDNEIAVNKKVRVYVGLNNPFPGYEDIVWFKQGVFILSSASVSHSTTGWTISVTGKDKMAMLDGTAGGTLPASTVFHEREVINADGSVLIEYPTIHQIIFEAVNHFGGEQEKNIIISDLDETCKLLVKYIGEKPLWFNDDYTAFAATGDDEHRIVKGQDAGYQITEFTYPGELVLSAGDTVVTLLDKVKGILSNFEYYYDIDGVFHFQQIKNYLNTASPLNELKADDYVKTYDNQKVEARLTARDAAAVQVAPKYDNVKNDFIVWGTKDNVAFHYHLAIDQKPVKEQSKYFYKNMYEVTDDDGNKSLVVTDGTVEGTLLAPALSLDFEWREELYRQAIAAQYNSDEYTPYYSPELLTWWRELYDPDKYGGWSPAVKNAPETLTYWLDFIDTDSAVGAYSVGQIGRRTKVDNSDKVTAIYNKEVPDVVFVDHLDTDIIKQYANSFLLTDWNMNLFQTSSTGASCFDKIREMVYQNLNYNTTITVTCIPRYYLEPNTLMYIEDARSGIKGNYQITQFTIPLTYNGTMSITATEVLSRI